MKIKICGLSRPQDIEYVNEVLPDYIGFIFWTKSRRYVTLDKAMELKSKLDKRIKAVGVFLDEDNEAIERIAGSGAVDIIQLHGSESEADILWLQEHTHLPVWKAVVIKDPNDVVRWRNSCADMLLFDGGTGEGHAFDWSWLEAVSRPFMLAGGITADNVNEAAKLSYIQGVDASSSVEIDGVKDFDKIKELVYKVRNIDRLTQSVN